MYDTGYDTSSLYPIVHDLTEAEYSPSTFCAGSMCFSLQDLLIPSEEPRPLVSHVPAPSPPALIRRSSSSSSCCNSLDSVGSHSSEEKDESICDVPPLPARFHDAYVLTRQIYQGHHSVVCESIHRQSGLRYATKIFDRRMLSPTEDAAVLREAAILEQLGPCAGTISPIDIYQEPHHVYLVSEYAEGGSLQMRLVNVKSLPEHQVMEIARSLLQGLSSLHSRDICHRNLKPDNILLHYTGEMDQEETTLIATTLIADFGLAVHIPYFDGIRGKLTGICGSSFYAAPEVQSRLPYDTQADMWSLGVVLFVCLSGSLPFIDKSRGGLLRKITNAEYILDPNDWSTVSKGAKRFIRKLLRANPHERMTAEQALCDSWLSPPEPCVAVDAPIEWTLREATRTRKVRFDDVPKPPSKKKKRHRFLSILKRTNLAVIEEDDESLSSKTMSSSSTEHHFIEI